MRLTALLAATALAAVVLLACGGSDPAPDPTPAPTAAPTETAADVSEDDAVVSVAPKIYFIHTEW